MRKRFSLVGCIAALFLLAAVCPTWAQDILKVGAMFSLTGTGSAVGKIQVEVIKLALKEVNDKGGVTVGGKKMKVEAVIRDDETKPDVAVRRLREYQNDGINLLVTGTFAFTSTAVNEQVKDGMTFVTVPNGIGVQTAVTGIGSLYQTHFPSQKGMGLHSPHLIHQFSDIEKREVEFRIRMLTKGVHVMHGGGGLSIAHSDEDIERIIDASREVAKAMADPVRSSEF